MATPDPQQQPQQQPPLAYEQPDPERPASAAPTVEELQREEPSVKVLDYSPPEPGHDPYLALRFPAYRLFTIGWLVSVMGHHIISTALQWEVYERTQSKLLLGWVAGIQVIPLLLLAIPAGQLADKFDRRRIIALSMFGGALCSVGLAMLSYREGSIPWMFALIGLSSAFLVMGRPARSSLLPLIVPNNAFANAVTWNVNLFQIASMTGPAIGGYIVAMSLARTKDVSWAYMLDACCCAIFGLLIFAVHARPQTKEGDTDRSLLAGLRFVFRTKILLATMLLDLFAVLLGGVVWLLPVYASDILKVGPSGLGWLRAADAIGAITMGIIIAHLPPMKHAGRNMLLAVIGFGAATIVFGVSTNYALSLAMMFAIGALDNISVVVRHTLVQVLTPDAMRGRVSAVNNVSIGCSNELGGFRAGAVAQVIGPVASVVAGGIGTIVVVVMVALKWPQVRKYGSLTEGRHS